MTTSLRTLVAPALAFGAALVAASLNAELASLCPVRLRPWETSVLSLKPETAVPRPEITSLPWGASGPEGRFIPATLDGAPALEWRVTIDHLNDCAYPVGWPNLECRPKVGVNLLGRGFLAFKARLAGDDLGPVNVSLILRSPDGRRKVQKRLAPIAGGDWRDVVVEIGRDPFLADCRFLHFFLCECDYPHGRKIVLQMRDFRLGEAVHTTAPLADGLAGASLWVGERGDADSRAVLLDATAAAMPAVLHVENRRPAPLPADATLRLRLRDVITGRDAWRDLPLGATVPAKGRAKIAFKIDLAGLAPSYYHALADILVAGRSVLGIRKGSDDFLIRRPGESMTASMLLLRLGMASWTRDRLHGGCMHATDISLPHSFDPYDTSRESYACFLRHFALLTQKVCEGHEAAMPGLAIAAEAYRRAGDADRLAFAEALLWDGCESMFKMQDACGGVNYSTNELAEDGIGVGGGISAHTTYSADQTAEWMRGLSYATFYYLRRGGAAEKIRRLNAACRRAGEFLAKHALWHDKKGCENVLQNYAITPQKDGTVMKKLWHQEGRQCDVYQPRVVSGMAYAAAAFLKSGEKVPDRWWTLFDASQKWECEKMIANGWFDTQCGDVVEGGCHTFLGNIYLGEGLFGIALACRLAGRTAQADAAIAAARKAYRYVTDDCWIRGSRYRYPLEFWVGPYVYWLFTEWRMHVGREPAFEDWLSTLDRKWRIERDWGDFRRMPGMNCGRANANGTLVIAILGYLGLKDMEDHSRPWTLFD